MRLSPGRRWSTNPVPRVDPNNPEPVGHRVELELGPGAWKDVTDDLHGGIGFGYGIPGAGPVDLCADTGPFSFALMNHSGNSGGVAGYYSPGHAAARVGFRTGIGVRYYYRKTVSDGRYWKFHGWLTSINPEPDRRKGQTTVCTAADWMDEAARQDPFLPTQVNKRSDEVVSALVGAVERQPQTLVLDQGISVFPFALNNAAKTRVLAELQRVCQSESGRFYQRGGLSGYGLRFEKRTARLSPMPVATFDTEDPDVAVSGLAVPVDRDRAINTVRVTVHDRRVGLTNTEVLFSINKAQEVPAGATVEIVGRYTDPAQLASSIGGTDFQAPPVAGTDYLMNSAADGSGTNLTASFAVVASFHANSVRWLITNNSGGPGFITVLQARGRGLRDYTAITVVKLDQAAVDADGENQVTLDMHYESDLNVAGPIAEFILATWGQSAAVEAKIQVLAWGVERETFAMKIEPGQPVVVRDAHTATNTVFFVQHVQGRIGVGAASEFEFILQPALVGEFWTLDDPVLSLLDNNVLAPL